MNNEELDVSITELENEIRYFKNLGFDTLAAKFQKYLTIIKSLRKEES